jgi:hypothetical protein
MNRAKLDAEAMLLELVDFKWLMAGRGWWLDLSRLRSDTAYARMSAQRGMDSGLSLLVGLSAMLLAQLPPPHSVNTAVASSNVPLSNAHR